MENLNNNRIIDANQVFDNRFMETKTLYLYHFQTLPNVNFINRIDGEKAFNAFTEKFSELIVNVHKYRWYKHEKKKFQFDRV